MVVQALQPEEGARLRALRLRALAGDADVFYGDHDVEQAAPAGHWRSRLTLPCRGTFVATLDRVDVGLAACGPPTWDTTADPLDYDLSSVWVDPGARGHGVTDALLTAAVAHAREAGARAVTLWIYDGNPHAERAFTRAGFRATGQWGREGFEELQRGRRYVGYRLDLGATPDGPSDG